MTPADSQQLAVVMLVTTLVWLLVAVGLYVWYAAMLARVFQKFGLPAWSAWVPVYNEMQLFGLGGQPKWAAILLYLPIVQLVGLYFRILAVHRVTTQCWRGVGTTVVGILLPPVWATMLALGAAPDPERGRLPKPFGTNTGPSPLAQGPLAAGQPGVIPPVAPQGSAFLPSQEPFAAGGAAHAPFSAPQPATARPAPAAPAAAPIVPPSFAVPPVAPPAGGTLPPAAPAQPAPAQPAPAQPAPAQAAPPQPPAPQAQPQPSAPPAAPAFAPPPAPPAPASSAPAVPPAAPTVPPAAPAAAPASPAPPAEPGRIEPMPPGPAFVESASAFADSASMFAGAASAFAASARAEPAFTAPGDDDIADAATIMVAPAEEDPIDRTVVVERRPRVSWTLVTDDGARLPLDAALVVLGRNPRQVGEGEQRLVVPDPSRTLSKTHAELRRDGEQWTVVDLGSTNGVLVPDRFGEEQLIDPGVPTPVGERLVLGTLGLRLLRSDAERTGPV
ncbi:DUF5684 domain-containing protein [Agromyces mediolanus]|uniref:DUF5684 domain-containing protein n=1 Tax=Agromyces mediolanus TaxID=41986 RepID=UPI0038382DBA